ncbi:MAG: DUF2723 domain-containing protein [Verrucomicrobia bacterium]|nr:DUF2723 domain-containing protein [Verrucomicrobiota bacterium]
MAVQDDQNRAGDVQEQVTLEATNEFFNRQQGPFFRRIDWMAFFICFIISFGVYFYTMAPTVTLEDSGELAVASDYLGVPHPPGYPIWTLLTWFSQWIFHWVKYFGVPDGNLTLLFKSFGALFTPGVQGYPNPAWGVTLGGSVFAGALACGFLALLTSRSGADIMRGYRRAMDVIGIQSENWFCLTCGVTAGLLFAFSPVLWSQSTIVEVYSLNALFMVLTMLLTYRWMCRPEEDATLYITAFIFGLGLTNHQSLVFLAPALIIGIALRRIELFRDCMAILMWMASGLMFYKASQITGTPSPEMLQTKQTQITLGILLLIAPGALFLIKRRLLTTWKQYVPMVLLAVLGISFYAYLPVSSEQNPPMNWGYPRTPEGFWHALSRGQYEKIDPVDNFKDAVANPAYFFNLVDKVIFDFRDATSVVAQYKWYLALFILVPLFFLHRIKKPMLGWLLTTFVAFFFLTFVFLIFQYPKPDVQTLFIGRVQYIQAHAIFALWIGYGMIFTLTLLELLLKGNRLVALIGIPLVLSTVMIPINRNQNDEEFIREVGGCEQNGHDFGWQFGHWQLEGVRALEKELSEEEWASFPTPDYPPPMTTNAIFYGGTDPGRFVPTYMIYSAHVREDVYLITQNALADNTYMNVMRDLYGDRIWIPSQQDSNLAFQEYVQDVQSGKIQAGADVNIENGRVSVQGVQGVMTINGILARKIFDANKHIHDFYVEESYVIPWMYPFLEPHGLIMKLNREELPRLSEEVVDNDRKFWDWYVDRLVGNEKFHRDVVARKTFSKLRSAIAGLYAARRMFPESEYAFQQAIDLYPLSPEANFRLADIYIQQLRFKEARDVIETFLVEDPGNDRVGEFLEQIKQLETRDTRRRELEESLREGGDVNLALELAEIYRSMNMGPMFENLTQRILQQANMPPEVILRIAQMYAGSGRADLFANALQQYLQRDPNNARVWVDLAAAQFSMQRTGDGLQSLRRAVSIGGRAIQDQVRQDPRFEPIRNAPEFQAIIPTVQAQPQIPSNFRLPGF